MRMGRKSNLAALLLGAIGQALAWLPASIALLPVVPINNKADWLALTAGASLFGAALTAGSKLRPWIIHAALIACVAGAAAAFGVDWLLSILYLGAVAWLGSRYISWRAVCMGGVAVNGIALIAATWASGLAGYKPLFIVSGLVWFALAVYFTHDSLLESAGLGGGIVTRLVSRSSRRYLMLLLAVVLIVYLATSDFHLWRTITDYISAHAPKPGTPMPEIDPDSSPMSPTQGLENLPPPGKGSKWWDYVFYTLAVLIGLALLIPLVKRYLLNLSWVRELAFRLRGLLTRLFKRREPPVQAPFTEEKESLLDIRKALREAQSRWRRRSTRKPLGRQEWDRLSDREKVRRFYQESVLAAVEAGYEHRLSDTPTETLNAAEQWFSSREGDSSPSPRSRWLRQKRGLLADLYGRVRYGSREATPAELEKLAGEYPWDSRH